MPQFTRGDANGKGGIDISDAIKIFAYLFLGTSSDLPCDDAADTNDDGIIDISDGIGLLEYLFLGGRALPDPGSRACGVDPTADGLRCRAPTGC